jgi:antitoxin HigA-1
MTDLDHPGTYIRREVLEPLTLSVTDAAKALGVSRPALSALLNRKAHLSPEMALRIESAFGIPIENLLLMQHQYDVAMTRAMPPDINVKRFDPSPSRQ